MGVLACGLNTSGQLISCGPTILCCPSPVCFPPHVTAATIAFSHILWRTDSGWQWTGHKNVGFDAKMHFEHRWMVFVSENRIAVIKVDGSVMVWDKHWRTLHFQTRQPNYEMHHDNTTTGGDCKTDNERKSGVSVDAGVKCEQEQTECGFAKRNHIESSFSDELLVRSHERDYSVNKKLKVETLPKKEERCPSSEDLYPERRRKFTKIAVEDNSLVALDLDGIMYCGSVPVPLKEKVRDVAVGKEHSMALTTAGNVFTWGSGMRGQLGIGELCQAEKPVPVESLHGVPITTIACGAWHCSALSESGDLYVWGWNESGQLGYPYKCEGSQSLFNFFEHSCQCPKSETTQQQTDDSQKRRSTLNDPSEHVSENMEETSEQQKQEESKSMKDKRINPKRSQEVINVQASPLLLDFWTEDTNITGVQCGDRHTLYMLGDGSVWSAGMNRYGQLGLGHVRAVKEPCRVMSGGIVDMWAGGWNSVFITDRTHPPS